VATFNDDRKSSRVGKDDITQLFDGFSEVAVLIDPDGIIRAINEYAARGLGEDATNLLGKCIFDYSSTDVAKQRRAYVDEVVCSGKPVHLEEVRDDRRFATTLYPLFDSGRITQIAVFAHDVTEMHRLQDAQQQLGKQVAEQMKTFGALVSAMSDYVYILDREMRYVFASATDARVVSERASQIIGKTWRDVGLRAGVMEAFERQVQYVFGTGDAATGEIRHPDKDEHSELFYEYTITPVYNQAGDVDKVMCVFRDISERKQAEAALRASEEHFRSVFEQSPIAIILFDAEGHPLSINRAALDLFGIAEADARNPQYKNRISFLNSPNMPAYALEQLLSGKEVRYEGRFDFQTEREIEQYDFARSGTRVLDVIFTPLGSHDAGDPSGYLIQARDITTRKRAEEKLVLSERRYRQLVELAQEGIWTVDAAGRTTFVNPRMAEMLGYAAEEMVGETLFSFMVPSQTELATQYLGHHQHGINEQHEFGFQRKDGSRMYARLATTPFTDADGHYTGALAVVSDITEQKHIQGALQRAHDELEERVAERTQELEREVQERTQAEESVKQHSRMLDLAQDAIIIRTIDGTVRYWNKGAERLYGWTADEARGRVSRELLQTTPSPPFETVLDSLLSTGRWEGELEQVCRDGHRITVESHWTLQRTPDGEDLIIVINNDVTSLKRYSEHLEELVDERTAQLKDAERLAGIGETAAMIGHDLRNPLQGLQYIVDLQKLRFEQTPIDERGPKEWEDEAVLFDRVRELIFYMDKIVGDLQDYARPITPNHEEVSVGGLVSDVIQSLPHIDGVRVITDIPDLRVSVDQHLMHRVFSNLILNAVQAMPDGGTLTISASDANGSVAISVRDTGVGIPEELKKRLFTPLFTSKAKGTGLGLAVVKRIVDAHGGCISVESGAGEGSTFTVTLPATGSR